MTLVWFSKPFCNANLIAQHCGCDTHIEKETPATLSRCLSTLCSISISIKASQNFRKHNVLRGRQVGVLVTTVLSFALLCRALSQLSSYDAECCYGFGVYSAQLAQDWVSDWLLSWESLRRRLSAPELPCPATETTQSTHCAHYWVVADYSTLPLPQCSQPPSNTIPTVHSNFLTLNYLQCWPKVTKNK